MTTDTVTATPPVTYELKKYYITLGEVVPEHDFAPTGIDGSEDHYLFSTMGGVLKQIADARDNKRFVPNTGDRVVMYFVMEYKTKPSTSGLRLEGKRVSFNGDLKVFRKDGTHSQIDRGTTGKIIVDENDVFVVALDNNKHLSLVNCAKDTPQALIAVINNLTVL